MKDINKLITHSLINAMYKGNPQIKSKDAHKFSEDLINNDETVKNLIKYISNKIKVRNLWMTISFITIMYIIIDLISYIYD